MDEKFEVDYLFVQDEDYNKPEIIEKLFNKEHDIAYIKIPAMISRSKAAFFDSLNSFMKSIHSDSEALIIDVRANYGGNRDLMYEFAKHLIQFIQYLLLTANKEARFHYQKSTCVYITVFFFLFRIRHHRTKATEFLKTSIQCMLWIKTSTANIISEYLMEQSANPDFYYDKPVYILANEKTFSAASVFVSAFGDCQISTLLV